MFGSVVGVAGDVDRDGVTDFVVGDPRGETEAEAATLWIVSGATGKAIRRLVIPTPPGLQFSSGGALVRVRGGVDVDGDGVPDLLVALHAFQRAEIGWAGLVSSTSGSVLQQWTAFGGHANHLDWANFVEDLDHDGVLDIGILNVDPSPHAASLTIYSSKTGKTISRIPLEPPTGACSGGWIETRQGASGAIGDFAVALSGEAPRNWPVRGYAGSDGRRLWEHTLTGDRCLEGPTVLALWRDFDDDGTSDFVVSQCSHLGVWSGKTGEVILPFASTTKEIPTIGLAECAVIVGDVNHDGIPDMAFADPDAGIWEGSVWVKSGANGDVLWTAQPLNWGDVHHFGFQMASIGDVNGDGVGDLVVGTSEAEAACRGVAFVLSGKDGSLVFEFGRREADVEVLRSATKPR
jgi:hypothetical protein